MASQTVVGIDLGTTNSSIAVLKDGVPEVLTDGDDGLVPSCVAWDPAKGITVGRVARNQAVVFPDRTVLSVKRRMGTADRIPLGDREYSPQEISAEILKSLVDRARKVLGEDVERAVITVPAYFTDAQRKATREAGEQAGLQVERIINEPTAASLVYDAASTGGSKVLVYDLGGGTFDVSVVASEQGVVEVLATAGNNRLGGDDFDALIVKRLNDQLEKEIGTDALRANRTVQARLLHAAEAAKCKLSFAPFAMVEEDNLAEVKGKAVNLSCELKRLDFEEDIAELLDTTLSDVTKALNDARVSKSDLDRVLLVGGSTRIPLVARLLEKRLGIASHGEVDPDRCVALGAAMQGGMEAGLDVKSVLVDITPYTFGTNVMGELDGWQSQYKYAPIIPRNSKLPVTKSEVFRTLTPEQQMCEVKIYQGENTDVRKNTRLYSVNFDGLNKKNHSAYYDGIVFTYSLNVDGILEFSAQERGTGKKVSGRIDDALAARPSMLEEPPVVAPTGAMPVFDEEEDATAQLLERAKAALAKAPEQDLAEIQRLSRELRRAAKKGKKDQTDKLAGELAEILFFIE